MKRLLTLFVAAGLVFGAYTGAQAVDIKAKGFWDMSFLWGDTAFQKGNTNDRFMAVQRFRPQIDFVSGDNLKGVLQLEIDTLWGESASGGSLGSDGKTVKVKSSYIDWVIPNTDVSVRMGIQPMILPGFVAGSNIFDDDATGIMVSAPLSENVAVSLLWARPFNDNNPTALDTNKWHAKDSADSLGLVVPLTFDGVTVIPWAVYAVAGKDSDTFRNMTPNGIVYGAPHLMPAVWAPEADWNNGDPTRVLWLGLTGQISAFDPFRLSFDFNYGNLEGATSQLDRAGWYGALLAEYKLDVGTPGLLLWYASGDDSNIYNGSERLPTFSATWEGTDMGFSDYYQSRGDYASVAGNDNSGTWGIALQMKDLTFFENLSHTVRVARYQGTNNTQMATYIVNAHGADNTTWSGFNNNGTGVGLYLTTADSVWEVNFDTFYQIYTDLELALELGYMNLDLDKANWGLNTYEKNAYRMGATVRYSF